MDLAIRRHYTFIEHHPAEPEPAPAGHEVPLRKVSVVGVIENPYAGRNVDDLQPLVNASAELGRDLAAIAIEALAPYHAARCGTAGIVGMNGEQAHVQALLTAAFATPLREVVGGEDTVISSCSMRGGPGSVIDAPVAGALTLHAAPGPDEIAVIICLANR